MDRDVSRVLVVDDKVANRFLLRAVLSTLEEGCVVTEAASGQAALDAAERDNPDIILLDVMMPDMDGYEVCRRLKSQPVLRDIPVIFITALNNVDDMVKCFAAGAVDYIVKPIVGEEVKARLRTHLNIRRTQKALRKSEARYRAVAMYSSDWETLVGLDGRPAWMNEAVTQITGYTVEECMAMAGFPLPMIAPEDMMLIRSNFWDAVQGGRGEEALEFRFIRKDGARRWGLISWKPIFDEYGRLTGHRSSVRDITAQKNAQVSMDVMKKQMVQVDKMVTLGEMATGLAHEIDQPLGAIALSVAYFKKLMAKNDLSGDKLQSGITDIESSLKRMAKTINHLRVYARREEPLAFYPVSVVEGVDLALDLMGEPLKGRGIEVVKTVEPGLPAVMADPHQLEQVWINLISNARDAMDQKEAMIRDGKLALADYHKCLKITVSHERSSATVKVVFADNGKGAGDEEIRQAFEAFYTTKPEGKGAGLGLSISRRIIQQHQGQVSMEGRQGEGVTLTVSLPVVQAPAPHQEAL